MWHSLFKLLQAYQQSSNSSTRIYLAKWQVPIEVHPFVPFIVHRPVCMNRKGCANSLSCALHTVYKSSNWLQIQSLCKRPCGSVTVSKIQHFNNSPAIQSRQKYFYKKKLQRKLFYELWNLFCLKEFLPELNHYPSAFERAAQGKWANGFDPRKGYLLGKKQNSDTFQKLMNVKYTCRPPAKDRNGNEETHIKRSSLQPFISRVN